MSNKSKFTVVRIETDILKKTKAILGKDPLSPTIPMFVGEAVKRLLEERYPSR